MTRLVLGAALACALAYIGWLRRELSLARSRGDMYRDIAAAVDIRSSEPRPTPSEPFLHKG